MLARLVAALINTKELLLNALRRAFTAQRKEKRIESTKTQGNYILGRSGFAARRGIFNSVAGIGKFRHQNQRTYILGEYRQLHKNYS